MNTMLLKKEFIIGVLYRELYAKTERIKSFLRKEDGLGTVEIILILAVLVGIALIFRKFIFSFVKEIMENIMGGSVADIVSKPLEG